MSRIFVWLGGALFVASLALCTWWYIVVLAATEPDLALIVTGRRALPAAGRPWSIASDAFIFGVFAAHHSIFARAPVKKALARVIPESMLRSVYVWTASLLLILVIVVWHPIGGDLYHVTGWRAGLFAALQLFGVGLIARAVATIDPLELAGIREHLTREGLQITGPYRWVRHPLYLGWVIAVFGAAHMTGDRLAFAVITTIYLTIAVPWEERSLTKIFGEEYHRYQRRVRWRIIPYLF